MVRKGKSSTRNTEFNYYESSVGSINAIADYKAKNTQTKITLLNSTDYIIKTGKNINDDAAKNTNCDKYVKKVVNINTGFETEEEINSNYYIYGSPEKWVLDNRQQYNNCGVDCVLNVLAMAGIKKITNQNSIEKSLTKELWNRGLVQDDGKLGIFDTADGGTRITDYRDILEEFGVSAKAYASEYFATTTTDGYSTTLTDIANIVKNGGSAILAVSSYLLWQEYKKGTSANTTEYSIDPDKCTLDHAITVTGVVYDANDILTGFYIHDTGVWMTRYISLEEMKTVTLDEQTNTTWKTKTGVFGAVVTDNIKSLADNINATGNNLDNTIKGNSGNNIIKGLGGTDTLIGGAGDDKIYGGVGNDYIYGNSFLDESDISTFKAQNYSYTDDTSKGNNILYGDSGTDFIYGGNYNDIIYGGNDKDYLYGAGGIDVIYGGNGNDEIYGGDGDDRLLGGNGNDIIYGGNGDDTITGGAGDDKIYGGTGFDKIDCGSGNDTVYFDKYCQEDTLTSSSGSVTLRFTDSHAKNLVYGLSRNTLLAGYDNDNFVKYTNFFNSKTNKSQTTYLKDSSNTQYRISATNSKGNIKVADKTGNNIFFSDSTKGNNITTSSGKDIVFMYEGNDTITYTGGADYYYSTHGNDTYKINLFNSNSNVHIYDDFDLEKPETTSINDILDINTSAKNVKLFYDITADGNISTDLYLLFYDGSDFSTSKLQNIISDSTNAGGFIEIMDYFRIMEVENKDSDAEFVRTGKIETISVMGSTITNIESVINSLNTDVLGWLTENEQTSVFDAIENNADNLQKLIQIYSNAELSINSNN